VNREIIEIIEERMQVGARKYGEKLDVFDGRDWLQETLEELLDACVYLSAKLIKIKQESCEHKNKHYQGEEKDTNIGESYTCEDCNKDLAIPEPDWDMYVKETQ